MKPVDWKAYLALITVCLVWGTTYLVLKVGVESIPPFFFTGIRQVIAGLTLILPLILLFKQRLPETSILVRHAVVGFFMITIGNGAVGWAEMYVSSGVTAIICSLVPVWIIMMNMASSKGDRISFRVVIGVLTGFAGLMMIFRDNISDFANPDYTIGIVVIMISTLSWATGTLYLRTFKRDGTPLLDAGLQMFSGGVFSFVISMFFETPSSANWHFESIFALFYLIIMGSVVAYGAYNYALSRLPTPVVSLYAYINPVVAVVLGWLILDEKLSLMILAGCLVIVTGVYIVNSGYRKPAPA